MIPSIIAMDRTDKAAIIRRQENIVQSVALKKTWIISKFQEIAHQKIVGSNAHMFFLEAVCKKNNNTPPVLKCLMDMIDTISDAQNIKNVLLGFCVKEGYFQSAAILLKAGADSNSEYLYPSSFLPRYHPDIYEVVAYNDTKYDDPEFRMFSTFMGFDSNLNFHKLVNGFIIFNKYRYNSGLQSLRNIYWFHGFNLLPGWASDSQFILSQKESCLRIARLGLYLTRCWELPLEITLPIAEYRYGPLTLTNAQKEFIKTIPANDYLHPDRIKDKTH